jgi:hypothetical protein
MLGLVAVDRRTWGLWTRFEMLFPEATTFLTTRGVNNIPETVRWRVFR